MSVGAEQTRRLSRPVAVMVWTLALGRARLVARSGGASFDAVEVGAGPNGLATAACTPRGRRSDG